MGYKGGGVTNIVSSVTGRIGLTLLTSSLYCTVLAGALSWRTTAANSTARYRSWSVDNC